MIQWDPALTTETLFMSTSSNCSLSRIGHCYLSTWRWFCLAKALLQTSFNSCCSTHAHDTGRGRPAGHSAPLWLSTHEVCSHHKQLLEAGKLRNSKFDHHAFSTSSLHLAIGKKSQLLVEYLTLVQSRYVPFLCVCRVVWCTVLVVCCTLEGCWWANCVLCVAFNVASFSYTCTLPSTPLSPTNACYSFKHMR